MTRRMFALSAVAARAVRAADTRRLHAGAATSNITPNLGCSLAGNMGDTLAQDVHDELHVRAIVLDNGSARVAMATIDSCAVPRPILDEAKRLIEQHTQISASHVMLSATHSHSAPAATHLFQSLPDPKYTELLPVWIADAVRRAVKRLQPAQIGWGVGKEPRMLFCRRYWMKPGTDMRNPLGGVDKLKTNPGIQNPNVLKVAGPIDPDLGILSIQTLEGKPIAVWGNYALHYVGGTGAAAVSADYFPVWGTTLLRRAGLAENAALTMMTNACSGNINNVDVNGPRPAAQAPYQRIREVSEILSEESLRVWRSIRYENWVELNGSLEEIEAGVRLPSADEVARAKERVGANPPNTFKKSEDIYARETVFLARDYKPTTKVMLQGVRIGSLGIGTFPGEAFCELGLEVKKKSPTKTTLLVELANGYHGYIPTAEAHEQGGYETWRAKSSYLAADTADKMTAGVLRRLSAVAG